MAHYQVPTDPNAQVFRTYDIRGETGPGSINSDLAYAIGLAVGSEAKAHERNQVIVGRDGRLTGAELTQALMAGLRDSGCEVLDIGMVPTPVVYFSTKQLSSDTGVMVTASHNPRDDNGFKIVLAGKTLSTDRIQALYQRIVDRDFTSGKGGHETYDILPQYMKFVTERLMLARPLKVVVDCGNGIAAKVAPALYRKLGAKVIELFCEIDGNFPNHHPDPTVVNNLQDIIHAVKKHQADIGLAFDGDADRIGVVTNQGEIIWPDRQLMLFAKDLLAHLPGSDIVFDVKCSANLAKVIRDNGGHPIMYRTGHSLLKSKMLEIKAPLAGEMSGHIFFQDGWLGFDDGIYVGARLLKILSEQTKTVSEIFAEFPNSVNTPELKLPMEEHKKRAFMQQLMTHAKFEEQQKITIDGIRVEYKEGWGLIRPSNTSAYLILRFEADDEASIQRIQTIFRRELLRFDETLVLPF